ncbi:thiamine pyrophosphate-binding protein [Stutzerimonas kunmingensis]|uniref:thiamine pyrophosphate-binding protein n=1 Tax=Stutzerimonas kunmingensis TaxID=1211807 RepID=UPI0028AEEA92|nr:thiamine pyrophosphate-binding protein [Stutzerimonas kunmingensis]
MKEHYSDEKSVQILVAILKANGIKKAVVSPGTTNMAFARSMQNDPFFELYSAVDERSAAYMACGLAEETGEAVVISCTGATASRNYLPGLTEAFYRKLPILAVTSSQDIAKIGHHSAQLIDRTQKPKDAAKLSVHLPIVKDNDDFWASEVKINTAVLELFRNGGGPVHINLTTAYSKIYDVHKLPAVRAMKRFVSADELPAIGQRKTAIFVGSHPRMSKELIAAIDRFCAVYDAVVFCDHTSGYYGKYKVVHSLSSSQSHANYNDLSPSLTIHIGEVTGDYSAGRVIGNEVWRVNEDGEIRDTFRKLTNTFQMSEVEFFSRYADNKAAVVSTYLAAWQLHLNEIRQKIPEISFSNLWVAAKSHAAVPKNSVIHFGILNSLRSWNFFELPEGIHSYSNVGGFGIDGCVSSLLGASLANCNKLYFCVVGDLAFFYDMNSLGNRHVGRNIRVMLINNGIGTEFKNFNHSAAAFGDSADEFHAAGGHFGNKSKTLVKHYAEDLGFEYLSATSKEEFLNVYQRFFTSELTDKPILFELFTDSQEESDALEAMTSFCTTAEGKAKQVVKGILGDKGIRVMKGILNR